MKRSPLKCGGVLIYALFVATCLLAPAIAEDTPGITTDRSEINFGAHDIGSVASATLVVRNNSTASANVMIVVSGDNSNDFSWDSRCLSNVLANSNCEVSVFFRPVAITKTEDKLAQLVLSNGTSTTPPIPLRGAAFQNLGLSLYDVSFNEQLIDTVSTAHIVIVTNYSDVEINGLTIAVTGDFTETHTKCEKITPGGSCPISLSFAPKAVGDANGSLTITADQPARGKLPRVVVLHGNASMHCNTVDVSGLSWVWSVLLVVSVGGMYFAGLVLVRWHMIAKPTRAQLVAEVSVVRARLKSAASSLPASAPTAGRTERMDRINALLDLAVYPFKNKNFPVEKGAESFFPGCLPWYTRFFNALFWPRGQELSGWSCAHEAEVLLVEFLQVEQVRARLETAEQELRDIKSSISLALADRLRDSVAATSPASAERLRALLTQALNLIYERGDFAYFQLASWHSKMLWLVACALLFIFALAATLQNATLLLLGAVGGLLSRLTRAVATADVANDYGASWGALFLSPLSGALSAWCGILLIILGLDLKILGDAVRVVNWCNPYSPATLALALLFGFSERLFDGLASQIGEKILPSPDGPKPSDPKPGDLKPGDLKPGDLKPGDLKPGDLKPGDPKPGDPKVEEKPKADDKP